MLLLVSSDPTRHYDERDVRLLEELASRTSLVLENIQLYEAAQQAIADREFVLGVVAHDLRNPFQTARLSAAKIQRSSTGSEQAPFRKCAQTIDRAVDRANRLLSDLLHLTRIDAERLTVDRRAVAAATLVLEAIDTHAPLCSDAQLDIVTEVAPGSGLVLADGDRIMQVFSNLIANAVKFTPPGGRISVGARPDEGHVLFWVRDTGPGIPAEILPKIGGRFWQARRGDRRGVGLGLSIARGVVMAHEGRFWVESAIGQGTTVSFTLVGTVADRTEPARAG